MRQQITLPTVAPVLAVALCLACPLATSAQTAPPSEAAPGVGTPTATTENEPAANEQAARPSLVKPFLDVFGDFKHLPTWENAAWLTGGLGAAAAAHPSDLYVTEEASEVSTASFKPGAIVGGTPLELGAAFATYAIARANGSSQTMKLGSELIRAQVMALLTTTAVKQTVRRDRPQGSGFSFPSGHTSVTFASATVLQQHFGWKVGIPSFAVASYVAASRVQMQRHYLSDVAFGAALGIVAGRTVTIGSGRGKFELAPAAVPGGGSVSAVWIGQR